MKCTICGEYYDKEADNIYLRARYYKPSIGRFISEDTYLGDINDPLSLNLYTYCHNDAVNFLDLNGHAEYRIGEPVAPHQEFDEFYKYNPNAKATFNDKASYIKWKGMLTGAMILRKDLDEATEVYAHYLSGKGTDVHIDYDKAIREAKSISYAIDALITQQQNAVEKLNSKVVGIASL